MTILGTGIDIVENYRLKKLLLKKKYNFKNKIFTNNEIQYCEKKKKCSQLLFKKICFKRSFCKSIGHWF